MESELSRVVDALPGFVWAAFPDGRVDFLNQRWREYTGLAADESRGEGWQAAVHPQDLSGLLAGWQGVAASSAPVETEVRVRGADGHYRWFLFSARPSADASGQIVKWSGLSTDIDQRRQGEDALRALLAGEKQLLDMVASGRPMSDVLETLCRMVESVTSGCYCSIVLLDPSGTKLQEAIAPSLPAAFNDSVRGWPLDRVGGPCVMAARDKVQVIMPDVASDKRWRHTWRALAQTHGLRSCWSTPMVSQAGKVLGTFALYQREPGTPNPLQLELISQFTNIASITIERAQRDAALRESERDLRSVVDGIPGFAAILAPNGYVETVNRRILEYCGFSLDELRKWATNGTIHHEDLPHLADTLNTSIASGVPYEAEHRMRRHDGAYRWFSNRGIPTRDDAGQIVRWYVLMTDIEDRKRAEEARRLGEAQLADAKRELQATIDTTPALIASYWPNGERDFVNLAWQRFTGISQGEARGKTQMIAVHDDRRAVGASMWQKCLETGEPFELEEQLRRVDGEYRWHRVRRVPARDESGKVIKWYSVGHDIDEQKQTESALRDSEARLAKAERELQLMIDTIPAFVTVFGPDGEREYVNKTWRDNTGLEVADIRDGGWTRIVHPDDQARSERLWREALATGGRLEIEQRIRRRDGQYRWHMGRRVPLRDDSGNILRWYSVAIDIEDQKQAAEALRRSEAQLKEAQRELQLTIDSIPAMVATYEPDGTRSFVNRQWREYAGRTLDEAMGEGRRVARCFHPDDSERADRAWRNALATGEPLTIDMRIKRADDEYRWHTHQSVPLRDEQGKIVKWYATEIDIEDKKRAEEALRNSEAELKKARRELQLTIDSIPALVATYEPDGTRIFVNQQWQNYTGRSLEEATGPGRHVMRQFHPDESEDVERAFRNSLVVGEPITLDLRIRRADGEYRWHTHQSVPLRDEQGNIVKWYATEVDIEDKKRAENALLGSEARLAETERELRVTLDSIPTITWRAAPNGYVQQLNKRWFEYTGTTPEEVHGWRWKLCVHPDDLDRLVAVGTEYVTTGKPIDGEARLRRFDGTYRWFLFRPAPAYDETGKIIGWYGSITDIEDRKQAEEAQRASEALLFQAERELRRTLDSIPTMTWRAAPNGYVEQINKQAFDYTGAKPEEMAGNRWHHVVHPDDLPGLLAKGNANVPAGRPVDHEARLRRADGEYRWFLFRLAPSRDETGKVIAWYGSITDIEDRKQAEQALRESESRLAQAERELRRTLDSIPTMTWRAAPNGYVQQINKQFFDYTGATPEQMRGKGWQSVVHPDDLQPLLETGQSYVPSGLPIDAEARVRRFDGTYRWFLFRPAPARDETGNIIAWYGSITDIEDRKRAEAALKRSETLLSEGQQISSTGTYAWSGDPAERMFLSDEFCRIFEYDPDIPVTFKQLTDRFHPEDLPLVAEKIKRIDTGLENPEWQVRLRMPDGRIKYVRVIGRIIRLQDGRSERVGAVQDVTRSQLAEEALDKVRSELARVTRVMSLGALTASIAHEVNQPLAGIVTNASTCLRMLAADPPNVEGARETARRTIRDGNRAADVIARLRALFSKQAGAAETVDLNEATREVLALVFSDLLRNRIIARVELDDDHPLLITGDRVQLQQVILNLVRNALDAMSEVNDRPRQLLVRADEEDGHARLVVKDAGVGFEPQGVERLFDAFYTTKDDGMGIGLSVSRSIIESHGGRLWAERNEGPGATFSFSIPRQTTSAGDESAIWMRPTRGAQDPTRNA